MDFGSIKISTEFLLVRKAITQSRFRKKVEENHTDTKRKARKHLVLVRVAVRWERKETWGEFHAHLP